MFTSEQEVSKCKVESGVCADLVHDAGGHFVKIKTSGINDRDFQVEHIANLS